MSFDFSTAIREGYRTVIIRLEKKSEKLTKEAKGYLDALRAMTAAQLRISQTIGHFYDDTIIMGPGGQEYKKIIEKLDEEAKTELVNYLPLFE